MVSPTISPSLSHQVPNKQRFAHRQGQCAAAAHQGRAVLGQNPWESLKIQWFSHDVACKHSRSGVYFKFLDLPFYPSISVGL